MDSREQWKATDKHSITITPNNAEMTREEYTGDKRREAIRKGTERLRDLIAEENKVHPSALLTISEALELLPYSRQWLYNMIGRGDIKTYGTERKRFLHREQVLEAMNISKG